ncbi:hypothetical protein EDE08_104422 [Bradyrhizobium sp. R2.2-H]|jgi:hypothetical protein|uniref:hypothetical protein n=1 Tax=unclassified Bradyrhizobium TaxID=2631580 RepID=UPI00104985AD|nr:MULTISPECIES: hypothetical protein [unclassified Bradyrhizobium]TCU73554.1 hypothetical protein EDE10_104220 [Bradyrhizobium sp. Y-H1]TCU76256.1 hypothetical protein EDE08_104422 [Bradyrhizobium sp. R2.2-H]
MAKSSKPTGTSRIKLIVLDAEVADDQIHTLTAALTNALRPAAPAPALRRLPPAPPQLNGGGEPEQEEMDFDRVDAGDEAEVITLKKPRSSSPRKPPKAPDVVDIDMNAPLSFSDFSKGKDDGSQHKKFLIAAAWLAEHRNVPIVTDGHIYTCFRSIGWSTAINDFSQPLRELKGRKFFTTPERGHYEINHIGLDYVNKKLANGAE